MTPTNIPPCPVCGVVPKLPLLCSCLAHTVNKIDSNPTEWSASKFWGVLSDIALAGALRDLGIETVAQVNAMMTIVDAADGEIDHLMTGQNIWDETDMAYNAKIREAHEIYGQVVRRRAAEGER